MYRRIGKRVMDLALAVPVLVVLTPVGLALGGLIRLKLGGPVLFRQQRPGREGRVFELIKFRTMSNTRGTDGELLPDEERLTPFGARLRRLSLDELPTLWNVVRGDMSLVGPRPLLVRYLDRYTPEQRHRHDVLPGITGWAQVNGRNAITWEEKFEHDVWYVENVSLRTDLAILFRTMAQVLGKRGISAEGHATMPEFMGADDE
ncbi:MAG: sugar transferase [Deltaproteobacteria bacterium]|nr:sugar transferase [Deltaproteobacteria bacterium]MBW2587937.1 sugar transferase [Deltaproteobacteria bacterium]MBW2629149.1 sugar transferase [Deltaproteobacteria bacterium]MBW2686899.1 sugar transferase [Deltaproteobacteria bacterium]